MSDPQDDAREEKGGKLGMVIYLPLLFITALVIYLIIWALR